MHTLRSCFMQLEILDFSCFLSIISKFNSVCNNPHKTETSSVYIMHQYLVHNVILCHTVGLCPVQA